MFTSDSKGNTTSYPLSWPVGWKRTARGRIAWSNFGKHTATECARKLTNEVRLLPATGMVISSNIKLRLDGLPYSNQRQPDDCGTAAYFHYHDKPIVLACDRWRTVEENLWAIAKHIEALRGQERWGVGNLGQAFAGYMALPAPAGGNWWEVLGVSQSSSPDEVRVAYRTLVRQHHPDTGGDAEKFLAIQRAYEAAEKRVPA